MEVFLTKSVLVCAKTFQFHEHKYQRRNLKMLLSLICLIFLDFLDIFDFLDFLDFFEKKLKKKKKIWKKKFDENLKKWLENHWQSHKNIIWNWKYLFYSKFHWSALVCAEKKVQISMYHKQYIKKSMNILLCNVFKVTKSG